MKKRIYALLLAAVMAFGVSACGSRGSDSADGNGFQEIHHGLVLDIQCFQTLLDLYSILQTQGTLEGLTINMVGDLKYGRTTHSLLQAMSHFNPKFVFTAPKELMMPKEYKDFLDANGIEYIETTSLEEHLNNCDILYMTRVQQERFTDPMEYERVKDVYTLNASMLGNVKENMKILHPLPRVTEIDQDVDETPYAYYFKQAENGLYVRMAIISYLLGYR